MAEYENDDDDVVGKYVNGSDKKAKSNRKEEELERRLTVLQNLIESNHIGEQEK